MLPPVKRCPCDPTWVLTLEEEGLGLAVLEAEDFAVAADVEFALSEVEPRQRVLSLSSRSWFLEVLL